MFASRVCDRGGKPKCCRQSFDELHYFDATLSEDIRVWMQGRCRSFGPVVRAKAIVVDVGRESSAQTVARMRERVRKMV